MPEHNPNNKNYDERYIRRANYRRLKQIKRRRRNRTMIVVGTAGIVIIISIIITASVKTHNTPPGNTPAVSSATTATSATSANKTKLAKPRPTIKEIPDNGQEGHLDSDTLLYFWDNKAFELFYGDEDTAKEYSNAINRYKSELRKKINNIKIYNMVVPNHSEFGLCKREEQNLVKMGTKSQRKNTSTIYSGLSKDIISVDIYDILNSHKTEYIYFNTDHHWTGLGAYYAYTEFAKKAGLKPLKLDGIKKKSVDGFLGSFYTQSNSSVLSDNPDHVDYYPLPGNYSTKLFSSNSNEPQDIDMYYNNAQPGQNTYGVFIWGDNPLTVIKNKDIDSKAKIALIKESYGNAFAPYLAYNYNEVHVIDFRHFKGNLAKYCKQNDINNVLFLNGIMSANTGVQVSLMDSLFVGNSAGDYNLTATDNES